MLPKFNWSLFHLLMLRRNGHVTRVGRWRISWSKYCSRISCSILNSLWSPVTLVESISDTCPTLFIEKKRICLIFIGHLWITQSGSAERFLEIFPFQWIHLGFWITAKTVSQWYLSFQFIKNFDSAMLRRTQRWQASLALCSSPKQNLWLFCTYTPLEGKTNWTFWCAEPTRSKPAKGVELPYGCIQIVNATVWKKIKFDIYSICIQ